MAKYPSPSPKVLNTSGHVPMKAQMAHAAVPHTHYQEGGAPGTRSIAETTHGMANGGIATAQVGNPAAPNAGAARTMNPVAAAAISVPGGKTMGVPGARSTARSAPRNIGNIAKGK